MKTPLTQQKQSERHSHFIPFFFLTWLAVFSLTPYLINQYAQPVDTSRPTVVINTDSLFRGLCYGPHRDNENPDLGIQPTRDEMIEDLTFIKLLTPIIRGYGTTDNLEQIPIICDSLGLDCWPGAWISKLDCENERQVDSLISILNLNLPLVKGVIVGNEVLLRRDVTASELVEFINRVNDATDLPVATAEIVGDWLAHPELVEAVDVMFVHIYPFWDGIAVEDGANYVLQKWNELRGRYPNKPMVIGETGWPSAGDPNNDAVPSPENQRLYLSDFIAMAESNDIDYFYFEVFDEKWKTEGTVGPHWGMYKSDGTLKPLLADLIPEQALGNEINRPPRILDTTEMDLPLYVYRDGCDPINSFFASGWMGELEDILNDTISDPNEILNERWTANPYSGETCIQISYTPSFNQWGGVYWQFPVNNWGISPGYDFTNSLDENATVILRFWARGENGGERAQFKTGGIRDLTLPYSDSFGPVTTQPAIITLSSEWTQYTINLTGQNLSNVMGGFVWVTNFNQNPQGATIYLDEIIFEVDNDGDGVYSMEDCNDNDPSTYPSAEEVCDGQDNNCNGLVDDDDPEITGQPVWYADSDGDGYGDTNTVLLACDTLLAGYVTNSDDCDDDNPDIHPGATENPNNGIDEDCDGNDLVNVQFITTSFPFNIYPNPFKDKFYISCDCQLRISYGVYNQMGQNIENGSLRFDRNQASVSLETHAPGIYFVQLMDEENKMLAAKKIVLIK